MKHTKGSWNKMVVRYSETLVIHTQGNLICSMPDLVGTTEEYQKEVQANADLISAAPDLLEAVKFSISCLLDLNKEMGQIGDNGDQALQALESALKLAEGGCDV